MKCKYCGKQDTEEHLVKTVRIKDGETVFDKRTKKPLYDYYHLECKKRSDNVRDLKDYISILYGTDRPFPTRIMRELKPYWERYGYDALLSYLYSIKNYLENAKCNNQTHRMNLLVYMVKNNLDEYVETNRKTEIPIQQEVNFIVHKPANSFNDESFDLI